MNRINGQIILASASPRRKELLHQVGLSPDIIPSQREEKIISRDPEQTVKELSRQKAEDVAALCTDRKDMSVVIGADTVVAVDGRILGKPGSEKEALEMLELLQGREHQVYTGVTMICTQRGTDYLCGTDECPCMCYESGAEKGLCGDRRAHG